MSTLITPELVALDKNLGTEPSAVIRHLAELVVAAGRATGVEGLAADALAREAKTATGINGGRGLPRGRVGRIPNPTCRG